MCFLFLWMCLKISYNGILSYVAFCVWPLNWRNSFKVNLCCSNCQYFISFYIPWYGYTTVCLYTHQLADIGLLYFLAIILLWTFTSRFLHGPVFHLPWVFTLVFCKEPTYTVSKIRMSCFETLSHNWFSICYLSMLQSCYLIHVLYLCVHSISVCEEIYKILVLIEYIK